MGKHEGNGRKFVKGRLFGLQACDAAENIAIDQAILNEVSDSGTPTIRFYTWAKPTLSLGYFQPHNDAEQFVSDVSFVRRSTGGGAILHEHELTYSIALPMGSRQTCERHDLYVCIHAAISEVLRDHAVVARPFREDKRLPGDESSFLCFQRRTDEDLIVSGYKVLGSAQRRSKTAVLQHGSLLIQASSHAPQLPGIFDLTSRTLSTSELVSQVAEKVGDRLDITWGECEISDELLRSANEILEEKFASKTWWEKR